MMPLIFSCEHATCSIPTANKEALLSQAERITSAEGWDVGSLNLAQSFSMKFRTPLVHCEYSRLIIDCHCREDDPARWSEFYETFTDMQRERLQLKHLVAHALTLRQRVANELERNDAVVHVSVHTFDPELHPGVDVSLLYSEGKVGESSIALAWMTAMREELPGLKVVGNSKFYPDRSQTVLDGLREEFGSQRYIGLELQVSNEMFLAPKLMRWEKFKGVLQSSLLRALQ
jgi:predicted N-formylglutamate amidohydrolase